MDYFILTQKNKKYPGSPFYVCVNSITRAKDALGKDVTTFVSTGVVNTIDT